MALSTFWTACLSDWTDRQVVTCVGGLLYLTTGWLVVMSVIYLETQKMNSTIVASHVELWMGWMNQDPYSCFCRQHTQTFDWLVFWMTDSLTEPVHWQSVWPVQNMLCMRLETQRDCCVFCTSSSSSQFSLSAGTHWEDMECVNLRERAGMLPRSLDSHSLHAHQA